MEVISIESESVSIDAVILPEKLKESETVMEYV